MKTRKIPDGYEAMTVECSHDWREIDSQFNNQWVEEVVCKKCGVVGERDLSTNVVEYPVT